MRRWHGATCFTFTILFSYQPVVFGCQDGEGVPANPDRLPESRVKRRITPLPWPFPGDFKDQRLWNNYQQPTDTYIHGGLDLIQDAGTEVRAVDQGKVVLISTNYPDWKTHQFFIVAPEEGIDEGWSYTHVDPNTYTFEVGDRIGRGQVLGKIVDFTVGGRDGADHLHLHYVRFQRVENGKVEVESLLDPLHFFDYQDTQPPAIHDELWFVREGTLDQFPVGRNNMPVVRGAVDIIAAISDCAYPGQAGNWGIPVVTLEVRGSGMSWSKLVLDQRGPISGKFVARHLYVPFERTAMWRTGIPLDLAGVRRVS